jgi:hypothetical protein
MFTLFSTDFAVSPAAYKAQKSKLITYRCHELDDALGMAREISARGGVAWEIEGIDGTVLDRDQISTELRIRAAELSNRPQVY